MLMAEELALIAMNPRKRSPGLGMHQHLNACLAGLLLGDLVVKGAAALRPEDTIVRVPGVSLAAGTLAGAAPVVAEKGPKIKAILSGMDRGLRKHLGRGTWDAVLAGLSEGVDGREDAIERLRAAAASGEQVDPARPQPFRRARSPSAAMPAGRAPGRRASHRCGRQGECVRQDRAPVRRCPVRPPCTIRVLSGRTSRDRHLTGHGSDRDHVDARRPAQAHRQRCAAEPG